MIKVIAFDVGHTLINYNNPLNWSELYRPALEKAATGQGIQLSEDMLVSAVKILTKYNTRVNFREVEICADIIFNEIIAAWNCAGIDLRNFKTDFFLFFSADAYPFPEVINTLRVLKNKGLRTGILTDVAYGMDNEFSLKDIEPILRFVDLTLTSVDVGYRKPNKSGFMRIAEYFGVSPCEVMYVGDEEKDIVGANSIDMLSVLIDRNCEVVKQFGQRYTVSSLDEIIPVIEAYNSSSARL